MKARCWFEEEPRVDFIRNIAPWDADDLDADRSRGLRLDPERPLIKVLLMAASGRERSAGEGCRSAAAAAERPVDNTRSASDWLRSVTPIG